MVLNNEDLIIAGAEGLLHVGETMAYSTLQTHVAIPKSRLQLLPLSQEKWILGGLHSQLAHF